MSDTEAPGPAINPADLLPILLLPAPMLRAKARAVAPADADRVRALAPRMLATMYKAPGIGLAAPQIGEALRLIVLDLQKEDSGGPIVMVNPEIVAESDEQATREEGCLSIPGHYADVTRPARVKSWSRSSPSASATPTSACATASTRCPFPLCWGTKGPASWCRPARGSPK